MRLAGNQWHQLADIVADIGQVVFATAALPVIVGSIAPSLALLGLASAAMLWILSIYLTSLA